MKLIEAPQDQWLMEELRQHTPDWLAEATVDREQAIVRNVALLGAESRNGYRYTAEAMAAAAPLYEGRPVFVDHADFLPSPLGGEGPGVRGPAVKRSIRDYAGQVLGPRYVEGRVRGDLHLAGPNTAWLLDLIEARPSDIGMSHVVLARRKPNGDEVERIEQVLSVDIVAFPATTKSFQEQQASGGREPSVLDSQTGGLRPPLAEDEQRRLIALLEAFLKREMSDMPVSFEKGEPGCVSARSTRGADTWATTPLARAALISAIRGHN